MKPIAFRTVSTWGVFYIGFWLGLVPAGLAAAALEDAHAFIRISGSVLLLVLGPVLVWFLFGKAMLIDDSGLRIVRRGKTTVKRPLSHWTRIRTREWWVDTSAKSKHGVRTKSGHWEYCAILTLGDEDFQLPDTREYSDIQRLLDFVAERFNQTPYQGSIDERFDGLHIDPVVLELRKPKTDMVLEYKTASLPREQVKEG